MTQREQAKDLGPEDKQYLQERLQVLRARQHELLKQKDALGINTPPHITLEINDVKAEIASIEKELGLISRSLAIPRTQRLKLRQRAIEAFNAKQWEKAEELLEQVVENDANDIEAQKWLKITSRELKLQTEYKAIGKLREAGNAHAVLRALNELRKQEHNYPDPEGHEQWALELVGKEPLRLRFWIPTSISIGAILVGLLTYFIFTIWIGPQQTAAENNSSVVLVNLTPSITNTSSPSPSSIPSTPTTTAPINTPFVLPPIPPRPSPVVADFTIKRLQEQRLLRIIIRSDSSKLSHIKGGLRSGYEVEIIKSLKPYLEEQLGFPIVLEFVPTDSPDRIPALLRGDGDLIIAALSQTEEREKLLDFVLAYFDDKQRFLVREELEMNSVCDSQAIRAIGVISNTSSIENLITAGQECNIGEKIRSPHFSNLQEAVEALRSGEVDAITTDGILLESFAENGLKVVTNGIGDDQTYGIAVRQGDSELANLLKIAFENMVASCRFQEITHEYFPDKQAYPVALSSGVTACEATTDLPTEHLVQKGDWLIQISSRYYGSQLKACWQGIWKDPKNQQVITNPDSLRPGSKIYIPTKPEGCP